MTSKIYRSGSNVRIERSAALSTLYMPGSSKVYNLTTYPDGSHQCVVMKPDQAKMVPSPLELLNGTKVQRSSSGAEVVDGHSCKVETVTVTRPDGTVIESRIWEAEDLKGAPVKIESQLPHEKLTASFSDVVLATPDQALFTPPDHCTPFEKMGQVAEHGVVK
jgi:predicted acyl esterase